MNNILQKEFAKHYLSEKLNYGKREIHSLKKYREITYSCVVKCCFDEIFIK